MSRLTVRSLAAKIRELPSSVLEPEQSRRDPALDIESRWEPCLHLYEAGLPYKIWTDQDVFKFHGLYKYRNTFSDPYEFQTSDIGLLVDDLEEAAAALEGAGYFRTRLLSTEQEKMGYGSDSGNIRSSIRLLNVSAIVREHSQFETFEQVAQRIARAAGVGVTYPFGYNGPSQGVGSGVFLMQASDWDYTFPTNMESLLFHEPMPELWEYFDSHLSQWMDASITPSIKAVSPRSDGERLRHHAHIIHNLICEADMVWTVEFEEDIKEEHRQALFDLMELAHQWSKRQGMGILARLMTDVKFQAHSRAVRDDVKAGGYEPVFPFGLNRYRMKSAVIKPLPRGQANKRDEKECKESLPRFSWLVRAPSKDGWIVLSLNLSSILAARKQEKLRKPPQPKARQQREPVQYWTLEYYLQDILADTESWPYQEES